MPPEFCPFFLPEECNNINETIRTFPFWDVLTGGFGEGGQETSSSLWTYCPSRIYVTLCTVGQSVNLVSILFQDSLKGAICNMLSNARKLLSFTILVHLSTFFYSFAMQC